MPLSVSKTSKLNYQEACEFFDYKENQKQFRAKVETFQTSLEKFCKETDQEKNVSSYRGETEGAVTHDFADGQYIRTIVMPKGLTGISEIHAKNHPFFIMTGEVSVFSEKGIARLKAPYHGITQAGTQRVLYIHEDCTWITVHKTDCLTPKEVKSEVLLESFDDFSLEGFNVKEIEAVIKKFEEEN
jgi:hypothetical protein|tara:strand:+ start:192 stop:749 length:558 start_codon:yes stop_codon:yes gene_type:complete